MVLSITALDTNLKNMDEFTNEQNDQLKTWVEHRDEILSEISNLRSEEASLRNINKEFPWEEFSSFRNFISHSYFEASIQRIWKMCQERIPLVIEEIKKIKLL